MTADATERSRVASSGYPVFRLQRLHGADIWLVSRLLVDMPLMVPNGLRGNDE